MNGRIQTCIVEHEDTPEIVQNVKKYTNHRARRENNIEEPVMDGARTLKFIRLACDSGYHCAIGYAILLQWVMEREGFHAVVDIKGKLCGCPTGCRNGKDIEKLGGSNNLQIESTNAKRKAHSIWKSVHV